MDYGEFRDAVVASLQAGLPANVKVKTHPGRFDLGQLDDYAAQAPVVFVPVLSADEGPDADGSEDDVSVAAFIVTKHGKAGLADKQLLAMATGLRVWLRRCNDFGGADASTPRRIKFSNLYSGDIGDEGVALGSLTWTQMLSLPTGTDLSTMAQFLTFYARYELGPDGTEIVASQNQTMPQTSP